MEQAEPHVCPGGLNGWMNHQLDIKAVYLQSEGGGMGGVRGWRVEGGGVVGSRMN